MIHECIEKIKTEKIDHCSGEAFNRCFGIHPMVLEVWFMDQDGLEDYCDNWKELKVNFCPYCGIPSQPERLNEKTSKEDAIV